MAFPILLFVFHFPIYLFFASNIALEFHSSRTPLLVRLLFNLSAQEIERDRVSMGSPKTRRPTKKLIFYDGFVYKDERYCCGSFVLLKGKSRSVFMIASLYEDTEMPGTGGANMMAQLYSFKLQGQRIFPRTDPPLLTVPISSVQSRPLEVESFDREDEVCDAHLHTYTKM